jgi:hypothetical protein
MLLGYSKKGVIYDVKYISYVSYNLFLN